MYNFLKMHKEMAYNSDIPHSSCLCEVCENASLLAKGMNSSWGTKIRLQGILCLEIARII